MKANFVTLTFEIRHRVLSVEEVYRTMDGFLSILVLVSAFLITLVVSSNGGV